jgi:pimeloyl-ACP methyl ester carboxylesterase
MSRETTVLLHGAIFFLVTILATSLVINIQVIILAEATSFAQTAQAHKIINGTDTVSSSYTSSSPSINSIATKKVKVGDIDISYKMFGKGQPLLLIPGFSMTMDMWDPIVLDKLSSNHIIIIFDNRGIGNTTAGSNKTPSSIQQFANDTANLIDALGIKKPVDILGLSMGGLIAQEAVLLHPEKVNRLIIFASSCGGKESLPPQVSPGVMTSMISGNASADTFLSTLFPKEWIREHTDYIQKNFVFPMGKVSKESLQRQFEATSKWGGTCNKLSTITKPTLVITGTEDITSPPANSLRIAEKIPGAWFVQIKGGGHGLMFQYPQQFSSVLETFLSVT